MKKIKLYVAGPWFTPQAEKTMTMMEQMAILNPDKVEAYRPRIDGIKLNPGEFHNPELRHKVFEDNIVHIDTCDYVIANVDSRDGVIDTGTLWEVGYAISKNIPVYLYDPAGDSSVTMSGMYPSIRGEIPNQIELGEFFEDPRRYDAEYIGASYPPKVNKILLITPLGQADKYTDLAVALTEIYDNNFKWIDDHSAYAIYDSYDFLMYDSDLVIAVIDDKDPIVSYTIGYAYEKGIPVITYTNYDYDVNIMLLCSVLTHVKGVKNLKILLQKIKDGGIEAVPKFDHSSIKAE